MRRWLPTVCSAWCSRQCVLSPKPGAQPLCEIGCAGRLTRLAETGDGRYLITLCGVGRFRIVNEIENDEPYRSARVDFSGFARDLEAGAGEAAVDRDRMIEMLRSFANFLSSRGRLDQHRRRADRDARQRPCDDEPLRRAREAVAARGGGSQSARRNAHRAGAIRAGANAGRAGRQLPAALNARETTAASEGPHGRFQ